MIVIERLRKTFPERTSFAERLRRRFATPRRLILDDVSLTVPRGEILGVLGGNGAGKSTLLHVLATLSRADAGLVTIDGIDVDAKPWLVRREIGFCGSAERGFYYRLTVRENLEFFGAVSRQLAASASARRIDEVLELVDLQEHRDRPYAHLSTGMRQRLAIARALIGDPPVMLFDEPTRAVDPIHAESIRTLIRTTLVDALHKTVVIATNMLEEAWSICHRVAVLRAGRVIALDAPRALDRARGSSTHYRVGVDRITEDLLAGIRAVPGFVDVTLGADGDTTSIDIEIIPRDLSFSTMLRAIASSDVNVLWLETEKRSPSDIFAGLIGER